MRSQLFVLTAVSAVCAVCILSAVPLAAQYDPPGDDPPDGGGGECSGENIVRVRDNVFDPATIRIQAGETVTWCYEGPSMLHNVVENGGAFRCAHGCDHSGGDGDPATGWSFSLQFDEAGTINYNCEVHRAVGMTGRVVVEGGGGGDDPGRLQLTRAVFTVGEGDGSARVDVERTGGTDGAVGVTLTTSDQTSSATSGADFTPTTRNLSWADGAGGVRSVEIPVIDDAAIEGDESFRVRLSDPTGGAALGARDDGLVTIVDDDQVPEGAGSFTFARFAAGVSEGGQLLVPVLRTDGTSGTVRVDFTTSEGTAAAGDDFPLLTETLQFADGQRQVDVGMLLPDDGAVEGLETFTATLSDPKNGAALGDLRQITVFLFDDDVAPSALTPTETACDAFRLAGLLGRIDVTAPNTGKPLGVNLSFTRSGDFAGIAYTGNGPGTAEHHLAFSTNPEETSLLRNPARLQLDAISLSRNQTNSDLVAESAADSFVLALNPTLDVGFQTPPPVTLLRIDDLGDPVERTGGTPAESKPGRGLAGLVVPCHDHFTERDQHVFRVLTKIARAEADGAARHELAIFRGEAADTFRIDVYPYDGAGDGMGRLAVELEVDFGPGDRLDTGTLRVLPACAPGETIGCTDVAAFTELQLVEPTPPGVQWVDGPYAVSGGAGGGIAESAVDFADLLDGTSWRRPL